MIVQTLVKPGEYRDSVALMLIARELTALPGVSDVSVVMGTPANKAVLQQAGMLTDNATTATPNDLLIVVQARDDATARASLDKAQQLLAQKAVLAEASGASQPRTIRSAIRSTPDVSVAVISVPGQYAAAPAWDALRAGNREIRGRCTARCYRCDAGDVRYMRDRTRRVSDSSAQLSWHTTWH